MITFGNYCRKADGRNYADGVCSFKDKIFPYPAKPRSWQGEDEEDNPAGDAGPGRSKSSYEEEILSLQARLHEATAQVDQSNSECVRQAQEVKQLKSDKEESTTKMRQLHIDKAVLKRRLESFDPGDLQAKLPRPGPSRKAFEDLTPRQQKVASNELQAQVIRTSEERRIQPARLSAYLSYRY